MKSLARFFHKNRTTYTLQLTLQRPVNPNRRVRYHPIRFQANPYVQVMLELGKKGVSLPLLRYYSDSGA